MGKRMGWALLLSMLLSGCMGQSPSGTSSESVSAFGEMGNPSSLAGVLSSPGVTEEQVAQREREIAQMEWYADTMEEMARVLSSQVKEMTLPESAADLEETMGRIQRWQSALRDLVAVQPPAVYKESHDAIVQAAEGLDAYLEQVRLYARGAVLPEAEDQGQDGESSAGEEAAQESVPEENVLESNADEENASQNNADEENAPQSRADEENALESNADEESVPEESVPEESVPEESVPEESSASEALMDGGTDGADEEAAFRAQLTSLSQSIMEAIDRGNFRP